MNESLIKQLFASTGISMCVEPANADKQSNLHRTCFAFKMQDSLYDSGIKYARSRDTFLILLSKLNVFSLKHRREAAKDTRANVKHIRIAHLPRKAMEIDWK